MRTETKRRLKLGVTGGIGSGKTSVCRVFNVLGISVFSADPVAREIMETDTRVIRRINTLAGKNLYRNGRLDRMELASLIFNDHDLLKKVNTLVHPLVFESYIIWEKEQTSPYTIHEAAILFESGAYRLVDKVVTIVAPVEERIERVIRRNRLTREDVMERIRNQMDDKERTRLSDYVINNSENDMIIPSVLQIHDDIMNLIAREN
jgi:dephospho-CoA kinase